MSAPHTPDESVLLDPARSAGKATPRDERRSRIAESVDRAVRERAPMRPIKDNA